MTDQLDELDNEVNNEHDLDVERWAEAIDARLERMRLWGGHGKEVQDQGGSVREGDSKPNFDILAGREKELGPVSGIRRTRPKRDKTNLHAVEETQKDSTVGDQAGIRRGKGILFR